MKKSHKFGIVFIGIACTGFFYYTMYQERYDKRMAFKTLKPDMPNITLSNVANKPENKEQTQSNTQKIALENHPDLLNDLEQDQDLDEGENNYPYDEQEGKNSSNSDSTTANIVDASASIDIPDQVDLWQLEDYEDIEIDSIPAIQTTLPVESIQTFKVGQELNFALPGGPGTMSSTLVNAINPIPGVTVWEGEMDVSGSTGNIIVSQGKIETQFTITTPTTVYTASVDNQTGRTVIVDQAEYAARILPIDDTAKLNPSELIPIP